MTSDELPKTRQGYVAWSKVFATAKPGDEITITCAHQRAAEKLRNNISKGMRYQGVDFRTRVQGSTMTIIMLTEKPSMVKGISGDLRTAVACDNAWMENLPGRIHEATRNATYWKRQITLRENDRAISEAMGLHAAWKMTAERLTNELAAKKAAHA